MIRTNSLDEIVEFVMEPEEEMAAIRFIERHKPSAQPYYRKDYTITLKEQAARLGLQGGYNLHFHGILNGGHAHHE